MPTYRTGEMFDAEGIHIVTANSFISSDGTLVMNMGAGLAMKTRHPEVSKIFGMMIKGYCGHLGKYGLLLCGSKGIIQTRRDVTGKMDPELIKYGLKILYAISEGNPGILYHLNHPGVSLNKLSITEIDHLLKLLPENVNVWDKE
jgi:hypothetical protein